MTRAEVLLFCVLLENLVQSDNSHCHDVVNILDNVQDCKEQSNSVDSVECSSVPVECLKVEHRDTYRLEWGSQLAVSILHKLFQHHYQISVDKFA